MSADGAPREKLEEMVPEPNHSGLSQYAPTEKNLGASTASPESLHSSEHSHTAAEIQDEAEAQAPRTIQRIKEPLVVVPRAERRGLFAALSILPEVRQPRDYSNSTKWFLTMIIAIASFAAPTGSSVFWRE